MVCSGRCCAHVNCTARTVPEVSTLGMSGANASQAGRSRQVISGANASQAGRSDQEMWIIWSSKQVQRTAHIAQRTFDNLGPALRERDSYRNTNRAIVTTMKLLHACATIGAMSDPLHSRNPARTMAIEPSAGTATHPCG